MRRRSRLGWWRTWASATCAFATGAVRTGATYVSAERITAEDAIRAYTRGSAYASFADARVGTLEVGKEADLVVLDSRATPAMAHRMESAKGDLAVELFALITMGDDRAVRQTYVAGEPSKT